MNYLCHSITLALVAAALSGCSSSGTDTAAPVTQDILLSGSASTVTVDERLPYNLEISGDGNTITIAKFNTIDTLILSGSNNLVTFEGTNSVNTFNVIGNDNSVFASGSVTTSVTFTSDTGSGNSLTLQ